MYQLLTLMIMLIVFAYILGISIVKVVDYRLQDVSLNMPDIYLNGKDPNYKIKPSKESVKIVDNSLTNPNVEHFTQNNETSITEAETTNAKPPPSIRSQFNAASYSSEAEPVDKKFTNFSLSNVSPTQLYSKVPKSNKITGSCTKDVSYSYTKQPSGKKNVINTCPVEGSVFKNTYYLPLDRMTPRQREKFRKKAELTMMTLGDYINWLLMYKLDPLDLPRDIYRRHLSKVLETGHLTPADLQTVKKQAKLTGWSAKVLPYNIETEFAPDIPFDEIDSSHKHMAPRTGKKYKIPSNRELSRDVLRYVRPEISYPERDS